MLKMVESGVLSADRYDALCNEEKWKHDLIFHEAGVPPIHTPMKVLANLPEHVKEKMFLVHTCAKDIPPGSGLRMAKPGIENTIKLEVPEDQNSYVLKILDILSSIELFDKSNIKNVRDLMDSSTEIHVKAEDVVCGDLLKLNRIKGVDLQGRRSSQRFLRYHPRDCQDLVEQEGTGVFELI